MIELVQDLSGLGTSALILGFLTFLRIGAAIAVLPVLGEQSVPQRFRLVVALGFTAIVAPAAATAFTDVPQSPREVLPYLATEPIAGLAIGIGLRLFVHALQIAGAIAAQTTSLSQIFGAASAEPQPAIGHILLVAGLAIAVTLGFHVKVADFLIRSYEFLPPGRLPGAPELTEWAVARVAYVFGLAFSLAAPFVIASLIYNIALGAINKAMPQLMVSFVGAPAITAGGMLLLFIVAPLALSVWVAALSGSMELPLGAGP